ncbi:MAG: Npt1/Npt2 family nucleotide transporter, partial [Gemmatimonadota bacterium]|nr:Npt1/Npt2 family nucleotide transporter [Gemmatimonadota bacterium]
RAEPALDDEDLSASEQKRIFSHPQVRLIAITVLLTVLVKQFVDYEYQTLSREFYPDVDELGGFLGLVDAATQWLPIVVLAALRPILRRYGAGVAVIIFPAAMILATGALAISMTLAVAVVARTGERMFRYSAERTGREILYVPVPDDIKLKAKAYIDVAVEKGIGKALSGGLLAILALLLGSMSVRGRLVIVAMFGLGLAILLLITYLGARKQYVATLARSFESRFASLQGTYVSLAEAGALDLARQALHRPEPLRVHFALDLLEDAHRGEIEALAEDLHELLDHARAEIRAEALGVLARAPSAVDEDRVRPLLRDADATVRREAVRVLAARSPDEPEAIMARMLDAEDPRVRVATLDCLAHDVEAEEAEPVATRHFDRLLAADETDDRSHTLELAATAGLVPHHAKVVEVLRRLVDHPDPEVATRAVLSAGRTGREELVRDLIEALRPPHTRRAAREALAARGEEVLGPLITTLNDPEEDLWIRRGIATVLGDIRSPATVDALIGSYLLPETEQALDDRTLAALQRLRANDGDLPFPEDRIHDAIEREVEATRRYARAAAAVSRLEPTRPARLLLRALRDAQADRQESVFR